MILWRILITTVYITRGLRSRIFTYVFSTDLIIQYLLRLSLLLFVKQKNLIKNGRLR